MKSTTENRKPYSGLTRSLVIAIDVGTTFSGVSYAILEPGEIPKIHGVTRFPGQEHVAGNTKIPSVIYYDKHGKMMAAGAEAETSSILAQAEDEGWIRTELFKLRLRPRTMQLNMNGMHLGPLPRRKTAVHVFGDFLAYLYRCTRNFITDTHGNGAALWNAVENNIQFVLSHPNGWEGAQQTKMRRSAVYGGLIPDTNEGKARIRFVTEGEASLHACVLNGLADDVLSNPSKHGFLIADAGGGTLDISAYAIRGTAPLVMEEVAPPDCIFAGSVFVSRRAREFLEEKLKNSKYGTTAAVDHITQRFDETTKRLFRHRGDLQFIHFGSPLDKDVTVGIRAGQLKLTGNEVANLFEPSVDAAVNAIKKQISTSNGIVRSVFLVGGYAASPWLFSQLQERLAPFNVTVSRPDTQTSKAVADGAIGFYCDHHVSARMSKFMYGVEFLRELDPMNPDHVARKERLCELPSGPKLLPDAFDCILNRGVKVKESTVFTRKYCTELTSLSMLSVFEVEIWCYRGGNTVPKWIDRQADDFSTLCVVQADLSPLSGSAEPKAGKNSKTYWTIVFSVEIHFGLTEFRARIKWADDGKTKYGPASIIYNERGHRAEEEEPDAYPEDDVGATSPRNDRLRSEPVSRALTPVEQFYHPSINENRGFEEHSPRIEQTMEIPQVVHRERTPSLSRGLPSSSITTPPEPPQELSRSIETEIEKDTLQDKKKGKGKKDKTPKATPKLEEALPAAEHTTTTPHMNQQSENAFPSSSPLWTTDPGGENKSPNIGWGTAAASEKNGRESGIIGAVTPKPSPGTGISRFGLSPSATSKTHEQEQLVAVNAVTPKLSPGIGTSRFGLSPSTTSKIHEQEQPRISNVTTPKPSPGIGVGLGLSAFTSEKREKDQPSLASKISPGAGVGRSPLGPSEPIVVAEASAPAAPPITPNPVPQVDKVSPTLTKKGKKKGASAAVTPTAETAESSTLAIDPTIPAADPSTPGETTTATTTTPGAAALSSTLTPVGLPEVTLSTKTPEPGSLTISDEFSSSLFGSNAWGSNNNADAGISDGFDSWGSGNTRTPKSRQSPKTPVADTSKVASPSGVDITAAVSSTSETKPASDAPPKTPGAETTTNTPAKSTGLSWGASTSTPKKPGLGGATTLSWGASSSSAKTPEAKTPAKTPWASKLNTPITTKTPSWGAKPTSIFGDVTEPAKEEPVNTQTTSAGETATGDSTAPPNNEISEPLAAEPGGDAPDTTTKTPATKVEEPPTPAVEQPVSAPQASPKPEDGTTAANDLADVLETPVEGEDAGDDKEKEKEEEKKDAKKTVPVAKKKKKGKK